MIAKILKGVTQNEQLGPTEAAQLWPRPSPCHVTLYHAPCSMTVHTKVTDLQVRVSALVPALSLNEGVDDHVRGL